MFSSIPCDYYYYLLSQPLKLIKQPGVNINKLQITDLGQPHIQDGKWLSQGSSSEEVKKS